MSPSMADVRDAELETKMAPNVKQPVFKQRTLKGWRGAGEAAH